jgi:nitrogen fixation protein FixH
MTQSVEGHSTHGSIARRRPPRAFTGRHMAVILVTFFGVVIAVNVLMVRLASATFGGTVVENSYVASQHFNGWLDEARAQRKLGWKGALARGSDGGLEAVLSDAQGRALEGARVTALAEHPLGLRDDIAVTLHAVGAGRYEARLPAGRWRIKLTVRHGGALWRMVGDVA